jgi:hypothetical protein
MHNGNLIVTAPPSVAIMSCNQQLWISWCIRNTAFHALLVEKKNILYFNTRQKSLETTLTTSPRLSSGQDLSVGSGT